MNDVSTGILAPVVWQSCYINLPVSAEIDVVKHEVKVTSVIGNLGPVEDVPKVSVKIINTKDARLEVYCSSISFSSIRVRAPKVRSLV